MSLEQVNAFIDRMKLDEVFREKILALEDLNERLVFIQSEGYGFTLEELEEAGDDMCVGVESDSWYGESQSCKCGGKCYGVYWRA